MTARKRCELVCVSLLVGLVISACAPSVDRFTMKPRRLCPGGEAVAAWKASGSASLTSTPPLAGTGTVSSEGRRKFVVPESTVFVLTIRRFGKEKFARQEVEVFSEEERVKEIAGETRCAARNLVATATLPEGKWDHALRVDKVSSEEPRFLTVTHDGVTATIERGGESGAFRNSRPSGAWEFSSPLRRGEICGNPSSPPPHLLGVTLHLACEP